MYHINNTQKNIKRLYYLTNHEFRQFFKYVIFFVLAKILFENILFMIVVNKSKNQYLRFEELIKISGIPSIFTISFILFSLLGLLFFIKDSYKSMSIYSLMSLPQKRSNIYFSKLLASFIYMLLIVSTQLLSILLCYGMYRLSTYSIDTMQNALLLAFIRMNFLRILLPINFLNFLVWILLLLSVCVISIHLYITISTKNYKSIFIIAAYIMSILIGNVLPLYKSSINIYILFVITILFNSLLSYISIQLLEMNKEI